MGAYCCLVEQCKESSTTTSNIDREDNHGAVPKSVELSHERTLITTLSEPEKQHTQINNEEVFTLADSFHTVSFVIVQPYVICIHYQFLQLPKFPLGCIENQFHPSHTSWSSSLGHCL